MKHNLLIGGSIFVAFLAAVAVFLAVPALSDPNHATAVDAVNHAGIPADVTPGPTWEKP